MSVVAIAAVGRNGAIGRDGDVPWHIPEDWQRFKQITTGCSLIMGRTTFEAIGRPLPGQVMKAGPRLARHSREDARRAVG